MINSFQDLKIWQKSMDIVEEIYNITKKMPKEEQYGLTGQMQRAAVSIPSNIAEGYSRSTTKEYVHFLHVAKGSKSELQTQLMICERLGYLEINELEHVFNQLSELGKMFYVLIKKLEGNA